jgi:hypothetical protein
MVCEKGARECALFVCTLGSLFMRLARARHCEVVFYTVSLLDKFEDNFSAFFRLISEKLTACCNTLQSVIAVVTPVILKRCYGGNFSQHRS